MRLTEGLNASKDRDDGENEAPKTRANEGF